MVVTVKGQTYYRTSKVCRTVGISKSTLFRWLKQGILNKCERRDRRGWRLFTRDEIDGLKREVNQINKAGAL